MLFFMKKHLSILFASALAIIVLFPACDKDDDDTPKTKTELLTTGSWKLSTATGPGGIDVAGFIAACIKDNTYTFAAAGTGNMDEAGAKCDPADPQTSSFTWNFASNETVLHVSTILLPGGNNDFNVVSISESNLVLSQTVNLGTPLLVTATLVHP
jgi:hypothetical protein